MEIDSIFSLLCLHQASEQWPAEAIPHAFLVMDTKRFSVLIFKKFSLDPDGCLACWFVDMLVLWRREFCRVVFIYLYVRMCLVTTSSNACVRDGLIEHVALLELEFNNSSRIPILLSGAWGPNCGPHDYEANTINTESTL